jgi:urease accessory protein
MAKVKVEIDARSLLTAFQLTDSFFPSGMFAHSHGLEGLVRRGQVRNASDVRALIAASMQHAIIPSDCVALCEAHRAARADDLDLILRIDQRLHAMKAAPELRRASQQYALRVLSETAAFTDHPFHAAFRARVQKKETPGLGAVTLGLVASVLGMSAEMAALGYCHSYAVGMFSAAIRLLPIGHTEVQRAIHQLQPLIADQIAQVRTRPWTMMTSFTPMLDIASMGHVSDDLRMFAS